jgi:hypothetical protein
MNKKFEKVSLEKSTQIIFQTEAELGEYEVLYQKWYWDGVNAESIIFSSEDINNLIDNEIEAEVRKSPLVKKGTSMTMKRSESGFTFVNFNFET